MQSLRLLFILLIGVIFFISTGCKQNTLNGKDEKLILWYDEPAKEWTEALPIGNGTMGAMIFGGKRQERLQLNESTVWTGKPHIYANYGAVEYLGTIRELLQQMRKNEREGNWQKAKKLQSEAERIALQEFMSIPLKLTKYQPMADLFLDFEDHDDVDQYRRELDLNKSLSTVTYINEGIQFKRESFASFPDKSIVTRISSDKPKTVSFKVSLKSPHKDYVIKSVSEQGIELAGQVQDGVIKFEVHLVVVTDEGEILVNDNSLEIKEANSATMKLVAATNFKDYKTADQDPSQKCNNMMADIVSKEFDEMYQVHLNDYQEMFNRVSIFLNSPDTSSLTTDHRIKNFASKNDHSLVALLFQYGRYLHISGSREGSQPLTLQGLWNDKLNPPWGGKMTCNINTEMNYWPSNLTGLPEGHLPLFEALEELAETGSITAREHYGADGWVLHHNFDLWRATAPVNDSDHGIWVGGSGWLSTHIWEYFLFTGDTQFLEKYFPVLEGAVQFYTDFLYEDEITGYLISGPSNSPENGGLVMGPTMDHQIIRSLFKAYILSGRILGKESELMTEVSEMIPRIAPNMIGKHGQLQEWLEDKDNPENKHRHVSHLWGVHPGSDITWKDEKLFNAAKQSLIYRGDEATGWSMGWKINFWARFLDGDHALKILNNLITPAVDKPQTPEDPPKRAGLYPNMFDAHPPFQIDGNFGATAGIAEMLLQSHIYKDVPEKGPLTYSDFNFLIHLLPALPTDWKNGSVKGLRARGGFVVNISWDSGGIVTVNITSLAGNPCRIKYEDQIMKLDLKQGESRKINL